jgi:methionyl-tRNA synthetase
MNKRERILVTSALPYANGAIHFGHIAGAYLPADMFVRYHRLKGTDVIYICGSDEHGVSILISAGKEGVAPQDIIDRYHTLNRDAFAGMGISFDNYSRTSLPVHHETAQQFFLDLHSRGLLKQNVELQLYDEKAGMFLPDRFVTGTCPHCGFERAYGDQCENCSKYYKQTELVNPVSLLSGGKPVVREATHWYFPLGDYQERLEAYVEAHAGVWKDNVLQQVRSWLKAGLADRPISRDLEWGIPIPLDDSKGKVMYVWFEAVLGYVSSTREWAERQGTPGRWKEFWNDPETRYIAFIGKDNIVFHCLMFPAMLMGRGGFVLPENVPANEFLNLEGRKFSKSMGWSIELKEFLEHYPADPLRYTLALSMPETRDSDFYWKDFQARNNNELADILGNFVNRTVHFARKNFDGLIPGPGVPAPEDIAFLEEIAALKAETARCIESYRFRDSVTAGMNVARACNKYFNDREPWKTYKSDRQVCATTIYNCLQAIRTLAIVLEPVLPFTSVEIRKILNDPADAPWSWDAAGTWRLPAGHVLGEQKILFQKIEDEVIEKEIAKLGALGNTDSRPAYTELKPQITIDDFGKIDLRTAVVLEAERVPKSDKLLRLQIDLGFEKRQVVAGIGKAYEPEALVGKRIIVVANLKPAKLFGVESQGMLLAATLDETGPVVLVPDAGIGPGGVVK